MAEDEGESGAPVDCESGRRFARVQDAFARACEQTTVSESSLELAGAPVRLRIAGRALALHVEGPFAPQCRGFADTPPALAIDLWDARESGVAVANSELHASGRSWDLGDACFAASPGARFVSYAAHAGVTWFDRDAKHMVGFYADGECLSLHQRVRPLQMLLGLWASDRAMQPVHAALVAREGRGVLLAGRSGSGKSTAALACLDAGYTYLGDDWVALEMRDHAIGHGIYASAALDPAHARRFPFLQRHLVLPGRAEPKAYALLSRCFPDRLGGQARIVALALPRVVEAPDSVARAASAKDALLGLVPSSIFTMEPRGSRDGVARFATLVRQVPAWFLDVGRRLDDIPRCLDAILAASPL